MSDICHFKVKNTRTKSFAKVNKDLKSSYKPFKVYGNFVSFLLMSKK